METQTRLRWNVMVALVCACIVQPTRSPASTLVVTSPADSGAGSLRDVISNSNDGDVITFGFAGAITNLSGELVIAKEVNIVGPGPNMLRIIGNGTRVFNIGAGNVVGLADLTISDGHALDGAAGTNSSTPGGPGQDGGGIYNAGTLGLTNCTITRCAAGRGGLGYTYPGLPPGTPGSSNGGQGGNGGGLYNTGSLTMVACTVCSNSCGDGGAANFMASGGIGSAGGSGGNGGGICDMGNLTVTSCTLDFNSAGAGGTGGYGSSSYDGGPGGNGGSGGAIYSQGSPIVISSTVARNGAGPGATGGRGGAGGGTGGAGGQGGNGGGLYCLNSFQSIAGTYTGNTSGSGGNGGQGGAGSLGLVGAGGNGGNGGDGGNGGGGGAANPLGSDSVLQNVVVAQNLRGNGGSGGVGGPGGAGKPPGYSGYAGSSGSGGSGNDLLGAFTSNGHNLISLDEGSSGFIDGVLGDIVGSGTPINAMLGALTNNGGPTLTCSLLFGSPAIDAGDDTLLGVPWSLVTDQRGLQRKSGAHCDIGAFELQWPSSPLYFASCTRSDGSIQINVTNVHGANLTMLAATNVSLPLSAWTVLGQIPEIAPGHFQYEEPAPANSSARFYRIRCP